MTNETSSQPTTGLILVVDDEIASLKANARILAKRGHRVLTAENGAQALAVTEAYQPHLILLDVVMPVMDGIEVCKQIKSNPAYEDTYIILISGLRRSTKDKELGLEIGADSYVTRPVAEYQLIALVETILRLRTSRIRLRRVMEFQAEAQAREEALLQFVLGDDNHLLPQGPMDALTDQYGGVLDLAVDHQQQQTTTTAKLRELGVALGKLGAGAGDVVQIHQTVMADRLQGADDQSIAYREAGQRCLLELMAHLVTFYRSLALKSDAATSK